jgi:sporulation protein YlmC with PRC-barrel domain
MMRTTTIAAALAAALLSSTAFAQTASPPASSSTASEVKAKPGQWRASKLIGVNVYNDQNEKLGDISEVMLDPSGKVTGYVIGVGGFLGMGQHDIMVEPGKIKFVDEPVRAASNAPATSTSTGAAPNPPATGTSAGAPTNTRNVSNTGADARAANRLYPDHGVLSATKDQLKAMPAFKF